MLRYPPSAVMILFVCAYLYETIAVPVADPVAGREGWGGGGGEGRRPLLAPAPLFSQVG